VTGRRPARGAGSAGRHGLPRCGVGGGAARAPSRTALRPGDLDRPVRRVPSSPQRNGVASMASSRSLRRAGATLAAWQSPQWVAATSGASLTKVLLGVPTAMVPSPLFSRAVPVHRCNYTVHAATEMLDDLVHATTLRPLLGTVSEC